MTQQLIITTPANTGTGDSPKSAFDKVNANFTSLFNQIGGSLAGTITNYGAVSGQDAGAAIAAAAAQNDLVIIPQGTWPIAAIPTIPANVTIETLPGAVFSGVGAAALGFTTLDIDAFSITNHVFQQQTNPIPGQFTPTTLSLAGAIQLGLGFGSLAAGVSTIGPQFHANWNVIETTIPYNPTEWQVYTNAANGIATVTIGTNQVTRVRGSVFDSSWVGLPLFYFNGVAYKVLAVADNSHLTVQTTSGGAVSFPATVTGTFYFSVTSTTSIVNVNGTAVTYVSGQPFINIPNTTSTTINGTPVTVSTFNSVTSLTLSTSFGTATNATLHQYSNIADEIATLRLQGLAGGDEENFTLSLTPWGTILQSAYAGGGYYRPIVIRNGEDGIGVGQVLVGVYPGATLGTPGHVTLGGGPGSVTQSLFNQAVQVESNPFNVNYLDLNGGATGTSPSIAARGTDSTVGLAFDVQGANSFSFTSHTFANTEFQVFGVGGSSWLAVGSSATAAPIMSANGAASNIDIELAPKGAGAVWIGAYTAGVQTSTGYITVKDSNGNTRKLLCL